MSNSLLPHHSSTRSSKRFSREGFKPIPDSDAPNMGNDATIDIPLQQVPSNGQQGLRSMSSRSLGYQQADPPTQQTQTTSEKRRMMWMPRGRRAKPDANANKTGKVGYDGEEDTINYMGKIYKKIVGFSVLTRYFFYVLPLAAIIAIPIIIAAVSPHDPNSARHATIGHVRILWFFLWIEIIWLSLWVSKTVAHYLPHIFQVMAGVVSSGVRKYSQVIRALEIPLSLVGWAVSSLATFKPLMHVGRDNAEFKAFCDQQKKENTDPTDPCGLHWINVVQQILAATVIAAVIYLVEKTIIQLISINYHRKQFNARIKDNKRNVWILGLLYDASRYLFPMYCNEFAEDDYVIADQLNISRGLSRGIDSKGNGTHHRSGSHTPMRIIQDIGAVGDKLTSAFGHIASEITGKNVFNPNSAHSIVVEALEKNRTAEALARRIWMSFVVEGRDALYQDDIVDVLGAEHKDEAEEAYTSLDRDGNGDISLDEMILTVTEIARERKSISSSIHDVDQAINVLDRMLVAVVFLIVVLVYVAFLNKSFVSTLATTGTALLSLSFVFSVSAQEILGSCIFLFVKHPYDIGDRVDIGTAGVANQENFVVEHISLLFTVFRHVEGACVGRLCQIPNIVMNTYWVTNVTRSKSMTEQFTLDISFDTTFDDIQILKNELLTFVTDKDNSRDFLPTMDVDVLGTSDQSKLSLMVEIKHKSNWANESLRRSRRSKFMCALVSAMKAVPIYPPGGGADAAGSAALPTYSVAISDSEAKEFAQAAAADREKARLVPMKKIEEKKERLGAQNSRGSEPGAGMTQHDEKIVNDLTSRDPAIDPVRDDAWASQMRDDRSTLGERPSMDQSDQDEIRGLLRRESTRGKRKAGESAYHPSIPTINEPTGSSQSQNYGYPSSYMQQPQAATAGYENQRPGAYGAGPYSPPQPAQYYSSQQQPPQVQLSGMPGSEMSQIPTPQSPPQRSTSNPYRSQGGSGRLTPARGQGQGQGQTDDGEEDFANMRPYSGV